MTQPRVRVRVLFVFGWLVVGGEETEVRLLAEHLDPSRYTVDVVACMHLEGMADLSHVELESLGVRVDTTPYTLSLEDTVDHLCSIIPAYDIVVSCQNPPDVYLALERLAVRPPLVEHGGLVGEAEGPKHLTARYVGVCSAIRDAAAERLPGRPHDAVVIPSMVDTDLFPADEQQRRELGDVVREELGLALGDQVVGWVGRLDRKKRVEDVIDAFAIVAAVRPRARLVLVGGPDAFMPEYADELVVRIQRLGLTDRVQLLGDRTDVPRLMCAFDVLVWLSRGEGMPHVVAEAGAAGLPVVATGDNGVLEQVVDGVSAFLVPYHDPAAAASKLAVLLDDPGLRRRLGSALRQRVQERFSVAAVVPQWTRLFDELVAQRRPAPPPSLFRSFIQGGFECSTHRRSVDRTRVDVVASTRHDLHARDDLELLRDLGIVTVREGVRWHLVEPTPGHYDFASLEGQLDAARATGTQVIWDLMHYGWPDDLDPWGTDFAPRLADLSVACAVHIAEGTAGTPWFVPVNEISFLAWAGGDVGYLNPFGHGRGVELKVQLVSAAIRATRAVREAVPGARFVQPEPLIHVIGATPQRAASALAQRRAQFQAWDMLAGRAWPQLGGSEDLLDVVGVNYYHDNQWVDGGPHLTTGDARQRPLADLLAEVHSRYDRPILIAETGTEGDARQRWLLGVLAQVSVARRRGVPVEGVCLYPVLGHRGWDDDRYCPNGLLELSADGTRFVHEPLRQLVGRPELWGAQPSASDGGGRPVPVGMARPERTTGADDVLAGAVRGQLGQHLVERLGAGRMGPDPVEQLLGRRVTADGQGDEVDQLL